MPTVLREGQYRYYFYSSDGHEPPHVHVVGGDGQAKIWLSDLSVAKRFGFGDVEIGRIVKVVAENRERFLEAWNDFFV